MEESQDHLEQLIRAENNRARSLDIAAANQLKQSRELAARVAAFEARVIKYEDLAAENGLLKSDIRNHVLRLARYDYERHESESSVATLVSSRDRLGALYLDEVRSGIRRTLTPAGYTHAKQRLRAAFDRIRMEGVPVPATEEHEAMKNLRALYEKQVRTATERESQARLRESIREEQRRERDAAEAIRRAEQEQRAIEAALARALADASGRHAAEVDRLRALLSDAEAKSRRAIALAEITKSGHVYVISNIGSFGPNVFKIGMTRRLEPMDRIAELGSASVPFLFDVHMMIGTDDAPKLEAALHRAFHSRRVNRANPRKEFFRATIDEIVAVVRENHGDVEYTADAAALEFLASQSMTDADLAEVETAYASAEQSARSDEAISVDDD